MKKIRNEKLKILVVIQLHKKAKEKKENTRYSPACSLNLKYLNIQYQMKNYRYLFKNKL